MSQEEYGIERLYGDPSLRDELVDDDAKLLLSWAEKKIAEFAARGLDDEAFDELYGQLRRVARGINLFSARRVMLDERGQHRMLQKIARSASAFGAEVTPEQMQTRLARQPGMDNAALIKALTALADNAAAEDAPALDLDAPHSDSAADRPAATPDAEDANNDLTGNSTARHATEEQENDEPQ